MNTHIRLKELSLLPDSELLRLANEFRDQTKRKDRSVDRASRRQELVPRVEAVEREIKARGLGGPPWWAEMNRAR